MTDEELVSLFDRALNALREAKEHPYDWYVDNKVDVAIEAIEDASVWVDYMEVLHGGEEE